MALDAPPKTDTRIAYGTRCVWWGDIHMVGVHPQGQRASGLPCCPTCGGMLMEMTTEQEFIDHAAMYEAAGHPGYVAFLRWLKGKCYPTMAKAMAAYAERGVTQR